MNVHAPESAQGSVVVPPHLAPPDTVAYTPHPVGAPITSPSGAAVAQLGTPPSALAQSVDVYLPDTWGPIEANQVSYQLLAGVRYRGGGHSVLVTTARPSPAAVQQATVLGNYTVRLGDGSTAWATVRPQGAEPNQVVLVRNGLIVTLAGDLPIDQVQSLAASVILK